MGPYFYDWHYIEIYSAFYDACKCKRIFNKYQLNSLQIYI